MAVVRAVNLTVAFLLELAMLTAFALWGFGLDTSLAVRLLVGLGLPLLAVALWGAVLAPRASRRLPMPWIVLAKAALFAAATVALLTSAHPVAALLFAATATISLGLAVLLRQEEVVTPRPTA